MSEAPERIWAWDDRTPTERDKGWSACDAGTGSTEYIRADLVPAPSVTVNPLEWAHKPVPNKNCYIESATALGLEYEAYGGGAWAVNGSFHAVGEDCARRIHSAKAAAQTDYEDRVLAAVQIGPRCATPEALASLRAGEGFATSGAEARWVEDVKAGVYGDPAALREAVERCREIALQSETAPLSMSEIVKRVDVALGEDTDLPGWMFAPAPGWQPIETAPRDEDILIYEDGAVTKARVTCVGDDWCWELDCTQPVVYSPDPTHWMPLPAPPSEGVEP